MTRASERIPARSAIHRSTLVVRRAVRSCFRLAATNERGRASTRQRLHCRLEACDSDARGHPGRIGQSRLARAELHNCAGANARRCTFGNRASERATHRPQPTQAVRVESCPCCRERDQDSNSEPRCHRAEPNAARTAQPAPTSNQLRASAGRLHRDRRRGSKHRDRRGPPRARSRPARHTPARGAHRQEGKNARSKNAKAVVAEVSGARSSALRCSRTKGVRRSRCRALATWLGEEH